MNTTTESPATTAAATLNATDATLPSNPSKAPKVKKEKKKGKEKAPELTPSDKVRDEIKAILSEIKSDQVAQVQSAIIEKAHRKLYSFAPDVEFSSNPEQKKAQRLAIREKRATLGFAQCNLLIVNAMQEVKGAESVMKFSVRTLANGQVAGTETKVTKTAKRSGRSGIRT